MVALEYTLEPARPETRYRARRKRRTAAVLLVGLSVLYAALVALQITRNLWFDELLTLYIAREDSLSRLLELVRRWDLNPPLLHLLAHYSLQLAGGNPIAARIPSVIEFYLASVLLFVYSARKLGLAFAALPVLSLWYSPLLSFATEARPYAALVCWFCLLLVAWDSAAGSLPGRRRRLAIAGVAVAAIGLMSTHVLGLLSIVPFLVAELMRFQRDRKVDRPLWLALLLPLSLAFLYRPFLTNFGGITEYPPAFQAGFHQIASFYWHTLLNVVPCLAVAALAIWFVRRKRSASVPAALTAAEMGLWATLLCVPVVVDGIMTIERAPFWGRYCITSALGIYFVCGLLLALWGKSHTRAGFAAVAAAGALLVIQRGAIPLYQQIEHPRAHNFAGIESIHPDLPLVAASGLTFGEIGFYESAATKARLYYLLDRPGAIRYAHATMFEDLAEYQHSFQLPGTVEAFDRFVRRHRHFLVIGTVDYPEDWLLRKLMAEGADVQLLGEYPTPYKDKSLFEVRIR